LHHEEFILHHSNLKPVHSLRIHSIALLAKHAISNFPVVLTLLKVLLPWIQRSSLFLLADCFLSVAEDQITILSMDEGSIPLQYASRGTTFVFA
jgi:hypothetical protein